MSNGTIEVVINTEFGGFSLSAKAVKLYKELRGITDADEFNEFAIKRTDLMLIEVVKQLGEAANGMYADLEIVEIPDDVEYDIFDYDGIETIHEKHRIWG